MPIQRSFGGALWIALITMVATQAVSQNARLNGVITLAVDATDVQRRILRVTEVIPAAPGKLVLYYPQWLPGNHAARGPIDQLAGLQFRALNSTLVWARDPLDVYRIEVTVPAGATQVTAEFQVATPQNSDQGRVIATSGMLGLQWNQVVLYPEGYYARNIPVQASLTVPAGWRHASALRTNDGLMAATGDTTQFAEVSLEVLVDSPLFAGRNFKAFDLTPAGSPPVMLNVVAEESGDLAVTDVQLGIHKAMVRELYAALGPPRFDRYDTLLALSDHFGRIGLEHHRSSENSQAPAYFRSWDEDVGSRDLLPHEITHSWNGKYRRPARLWTPHFNTPMQDDLLWVYEGMTQYYGLVIAARSGLFPQDFAREDWAVAAATFDGKRPGRSWRSVGDTTHQPIINARRPLSWVSWQRTEDYYVEGAVLWLNVDTKLRELSAGKRSLDDFSQAFFAAPATQGWVSTYEFADVVRALNAVAAFDWDGFLRQRIDMPNAPLLEGIERAGLKLVYTDEPNKSIVDSEKASRNTDLSYSLGLVISRDNVLTEVVWEGPAFKAGLTINTTLIAVNGRAYSADLLKTAITEAKASRAPIELLVRNQDRFRTVRVEYFDGLRYPHLQAVAGKTDMLAKVLAPKAATPKAATPKAAAAK
jgi:predicted metalloprotease with PDZ domain